MSSVLVKASSLLLLNACRSLFVIDLTLEEGVVVAVARGSNETTIAGGTNNGASLATSSISAGEASHNTGGGGHE